MLIWLFGQPKSFEITDRTKKRSAGILQFDKANVTWSLSLDKDDLPDKTQKFHRSMVVNGEHVSFDNVSDLHTEAYKDILEGGGYGIQDAFTSIALVEQIRESK
jgi:UDP-N-acetyl-2-amino-2-deoxyglucuronate dehydrogenase